MAAQHSVFRRPYSNARGMLAVMSGSEHQTSSDHSRREQSRSVRQSGWIAAMMQTDHLGAGASAILLASAGWAALCLRLDAGGHMPSRVLVPIARENYYATQAIFVMPLLLCLWLFCSAITTRVARALGGTGSFVVTANGLGISLAAPLALLFLVPDWIAYEALSFDALRLLVRVTAPSSFIASVALATVAVRASHGLSRGRACLAGAAGVLAQAIMGGVLLR